MVLYTAFNLPFAIWLLRGLREAAIIDGCTEFQVFRSMMLPLLSGGLVATAYSSSLLHGTNSYSRLRSLSRTPPLRPCRSWGSAMNTVLIGWRSAPLW